MYGAVMELAEDAVSEVLLRDDGKETDSGEVDDGTGGEVDIMREAGSE